MAFSKIMKKYDKVAERSASKSYMRMVDNSYLGSSEEVKKNIQKFLCSVKFNLKYGYFVIIGEQAVGEGRSHLHQAFLKLEPQQRNEHLEA